MGVGELSGMDVGRADDAAVADIVGVPVKGTMVSVADSIECALGVDDAVAAEGWDADIITVVGALTALSDLPRPQPVRSRISPRQKLTALAR